jgi:hypothetical protein
MWGIVKMAGHIHTEFISWQTQASIEQDTSLRWEVVSWKNDECDSIESDTLQVKIYFPNSFFDDEERELRSWFYVTHIEECGNTELPFLGEEKFEWTYGEVIEYCNKLSKYVLHRDLDRRSKGL